MQVETQTDLTPSGNRYTAVTANGCWLSRLEPIIEGPFCLRNMVVAWDLWILWYLCDCFGCSREQFGACAPVSVVWHAAMSQYTYVIYVDRSWHNKHTLGCGKMFVLWHTASYTYGMYHHTPMVYIIIHPWYISSYTYGISSVSYVKKTGGQALKGSWTGRPASFSCEITGTEIPTSINAVAL